MHPGALVFALWTLFIWAVRIRNADGSAGAVVLSLTFVVLAVIVLATRGRRLPTMVLGGWTVVAWSVRLVDIVALSDHSGGFKAVHGVIGVVSILLAGWAAASMWPAMRAEVG